jgi:hypothetical protein
MLPGRMTSCYALYSEYGEPMSVERSSNVTEQPNYSSRSGRCGNFISGICDIKKVSV